MPARRLIVVGLLVGLVVVVWTSSRESSEQASGSALVEPDRARAVPSPPSGVDKPSVRPLEVAGSPPEQREDAGEEPFGDNRDQPLLPLGDMREIVASIARDVGHEPVSFECEGVVCEIWWPEEAREDALSQPRLRAAIKQHHPTAFALAAVRGGPVPLRLLRRDVTDEEFEAHARWMGEQVRRTLTDEELALIEEYNGQ